MTRERLAADARWNRLTSPLTAGQPVKSKASGTPQHRSERRKRQPKPFIVTTVRARMGEMLAEIGYQRLMQETFA